MKDTKRYMFDQLCVLCCKRVYTHCEYVHGNAVLPICKEGKPIHEAFETGFMAGRSSVERQVKSRIELAKERVSSGQNIETNQAIIDCLTALYI